MAVASVFGRRIIFTTAVIGIGKILGHFQKFRLVAWTAIFGKARWEVEWSHSCRRYQCRASACTITINTQLTQAVVYCNDIVIKDRRHRWSSLVQFTGSVKVQMEFFFYMNREIGIGLSVVITGEYRIQEWLYVHSSTQGWQYGYKGLLSHVCPPKRWWTDMHWSLHVSVYIPISIFPTII